jgi:hypothetical protein
MEAIRDKLKELRDLLSTKGEHSYAKEIDRALAGTVAALTAFLTSNELWGGSGSIADQALGDTRESRREVERTLAELGDLQLKAGIVNVRTEMWTSAFRQWQKQGI